MDLPQIPPGAVDPRMMHPLQRIQQELRKLMAGAVTWDQLGSQGFTTTARRPPAGSPAVIIVPGGSVEGATEPDLTPPPDVTGLSASAGITFVSVLWNVAAYTQGHGPLSTVIYAAKRNPGDPQAVFGDATVQDEATHPLTLRMLSSEPNTRWHIWAKFKTIDGVQSVNPAGGTNGIVVTTGQDVAQLLAILTGQITESQLWKDLGATIKTFDPYQRWDFTNSADGWTASGANLTPQAESLRIASTGSDPILVSPAVSIVGARYDKVRARVKRNAGSGWQGDLYYSTSGHGFVEGNKKTIANTTVTGEWIELEWDMTVLTAGGTDWITNTITALRLDLGNSATDSFDIDWIAPGSRAHGVSSVRMGTAEAAITTETTTRASETGHIAAQYTVRAQVTQGGRTIVGGFGLTGTSGGTQGAEIEFGVRADRFYVGAPTSAVGVADVLPFVIQTSDEVVNGVTIPKGVYMDAAYIKNLTAMVARLGSLWVTNAMIVSLATNKILAGSIDVGAHIQSPNFAAGSAGWRIHGDGSAEFAFAHIRGTLLASQVAANLITTPMLNAGAVTAAKMNVSQLSAISADLGSVTAGNITLDAAGFIKGGQSAYNTGVGFWMGYDSTAYKFSIGDPSGNYMRWTGSALEINASFSSFTASIASGDLTPAVSNGSQAYGSRTVTPSGGKPPYAYHWFLANSYQDIDNSGEMHLTGTIDSDTIGVSGTATNTINRGRVVCFVTDSDQRVVRVGFTVSATHGTPG